MASKLNTEFNYRYQVIGDTAWERIKTLKGFLEGTINVFHKHESDWKLSEIKHKNSDSIITYLHSHFTHNKICLDVLLVSGPADKIRKLLYEIEAINGVELVRFVSTP